MTQAEYNQKLQTVQQIEGMVGFKILKSFQYHDREGHLTQAGFSSPRGVVFRQRHPFTDRVEYEVDEALWGDIVYRDPTR